MLKENSYKEHDIIVFRLIGGDEVIARYVSENEDTMTVKKPLVLGMTQNGLGMQQYVIMGNMENPFHINKSAVITSQIANKAAQDNYIQGTSSIAQPPKSKIIT